MNPFITLILYSLIQNASTSSVNLKNNKDSDVFGNTNYINLKSSNTTNNYFNVDLSLSFYNNSCLNLVNSSMTHLKCLDSINLEKCCMIGFNYYNFNIRYYNDTDKCYNLKNSSYSVGYTCNIIEYNKKDYLIVKIIVCFLLSFIILIFLYYTIIYIKKKCRRNNYDNLNYY